MDERHYRNRVRAQCSTAGTSWQIVGLDGVGYASYVLLLAAGTSAYPGPPSSFPTGIPRLLTRSIATGGVTAGSIFLIATNTLISPAAADDLLDSTGQLVYENSGVTSVWIKKTASSDIIQLTGFF